jgi:hypothetical protein
MFICVLNPAVSAEEQMTIIAADRGWYRFDGTTDNTDPKAPTESNFFAGDNQNNEEFRNWFAFEVDLVPWKITAIEFHVGLNEGIAGHPVTTGGYRSPDPFEIYEMYSIETSVLALIGATGGVAAFVDLGEGLSFGAMTIDESQEGQILSTELSDAAIEDANHARRFGLTWAFGGKLSSLSLLGTPEGIFAGSHSTDIEDVYLVVTYIPAPATTAALGLVLVGNRRRRL